MYDRDVRDNGHFGIECTTFGPFCERTSIVNPKMNKQRFCSIPSVGGMNSLNDDENMMWSLVSLGDKCIISGNRFRHNEQLILRMDRCLHLSRCPL